VSLLEGSMIQLRLGVSELGLNLPAKALDKLVDYLVLLYKWNRTFNLTSMGGCGKEAEEARAVSHHLLDSLAVLPFVPAGRLLDVGSGGGMPGIPLAIAYPECPVVLLDSNSKKAAFLRQAVIELGLSNVNVHEGRVEHYHCVEKFSTIVSRAFTRLGQFVSLSEHLLMTRGCWLAMKGQKPDDEISCLPDHIDVNNIYELFVPGVEEQRHLIVMSVKVV